MVDPQEDGPDYDGFEDEAFPPLPPPHSPGQGGGDDGDHLDGENGEVSQLVDVPAAKRKGVKRPQPKLDSQRLTSDRGLPALRTLFDDVHFKGKGCEAEDLRLLIQRMENWAHRLFPKMQFEDFLDRVEKLGNKKEVQTCLKRIRLDMPLTHEDFTGEEEPPPEPHVFGDLDPFNATAFPADLIHSTPAPPAQPPPSTSPVSSLTEEQHRRMELNRQRALERKLARQQQRTDPSDSQTLDSSSTSSSMPVGDLTSVSSANNPDSSKAQDEQEDLDLEQREQLDELQEKRDAEPSAEAAQSERDEEEEERRASEERSSQERSEDGDESN